MGRRAIPVIAAVAFLLFTPAAGSAYVGPGAGLTIVGAAIAFVASLFLGLFGFVWYPLKRVIKAVSRKGESQEGSGD